MSNRRLFLTGGTGGGPTAQTIDEKLWHYFVRATACKKVGLLTTPSALTKGIIDINALARNHDTLAEGIGVHLTNLDEEAFAAGEYDRSLDALCITCGNTSGARELWSIYGCEEKLLSWYQQGVPILGYSAGCILFFEHASTDSCPGPDGATYGSMTCLGVLKGTVIPHADTQQARVPDYQKCIQKNDLPDALALGEEVMAVYQNELLTTLVSSVENPMAARVSQDTVTPLEVTRLL